MNWDGAEKWYDSCVGEKGHHYHQSLVLPGSLRLLNLKKKESLLDLGCGQGVLSRQIPKDIAYFGIDSSQALIKRAKELSSGAQFFQADVSMSLPIEKKNFDAACFILSLQNIEHPELAIATASTHLKQNGKLLIVLNHPCFRIPRQSHWGIDEQTQLQYRRMDSYMSPQKIPIQTNPGNKLSSKTFSYHHPLSDITSWLSTHHLAIHLLEEWCCDKTSEGKYAKRENRARREFPLFLALLSRKK